MARGCWKEGGERQELLERTTGLFLIKGRRLEWLSLSWIAQATELTCSQPRLVVCARPRVPVPYSLLCRAVSHSGNDRYPLNYYTYTHTPNTQVYLLLLPRLKFKKTREFPHSPNGFPTTRETKNKTEFSKFSFAIRISYRLKNGVVCNRTFYFFPIVDPYNWVRKNQIQLRFSFWQICCIVERKKGKNWTTTADAIFVCCQQPIRFSQIRDYVHVGREREKRGKLKGWRASIFSLLSSLWSLLLSSLALCI